jgi:hypothetical protein
MTSNEAQEWSVTQLSKEIEKASCGTERFNTIFIHPLIIERYFNHCCKQHRMAHPETGCVYYQISCKKGLWAVEGQLEAKVRGDAIHYFWQYMQDGEYDEMMKKLDQGDGKN